MPTYEYECQSCGVHFERKQSVHDEPIQICPECGGRVRKLFFPAGIIFKGSGFYKTDYGSSSSSSGSTSSSSDKSSDEKPKTTEPAKSEPAKSEPAKPAAAKSEPAKTGT